MPVTVVRIDVVRRGGDLVAPEGPQSNAFLDQVAANCGKLTIGTQPIDDLLDVNSNDVYFLDEASKLPSGKFDKATSVSDINAFYPTGGNERALNCIFTQLQARIGRSRLQVGAPTAGAFVMPRHRRQRRGARGRAAHQRRCTPSGPRMQ